MARSILALLVVVASAGCVGVSIRTFGAASIEDLQAEERYKSVYAERMLAIRDVVQLFAPTSDNPGVCNAGGDARACYDADSKAIEALNAMLAALDATDVPPRFADGHRMLRDAIAQDVAGLQLRNAAIANMNQEAWEQHRTVLEQARAAFAAAYAAFPEDNRPQPPP